MLKLRVAVSLFPPMTIEKDGGFTGFELDLWEAVAKENNYEYELKKVRFQDIVSEVSQGRYDVGMASLFVTEKREELIDFSHPTLDSGSLILVNKNRDSPNFLETIKSFFVDAKKTVLSISIYVVLFVLAFGHLLWLAERTITFNPNYFPGIFEAYWFVFESVTTNGFGDFMPHTWIGRILVVLATMGGVGLFGILITQLTAFATLKKIRGQINDYHDLMGKKVGTVLGSVTVELLQNIGANVVGFEELSEAYKKLAEGVVDAVVFDAPVLTYFFKNQKQKDNPYKLVGEIFDKQKCAFILPQKTKIREPINRSLLRLVESGEYDKIHKKWFGEETETEV